MVPNAPLPHVRLGSIYYAMGEMDMARKEYEKALDLDPTDEPVKQFMEMQGWGKP